MNRGAHTLSRIGRSTTSGEITEFHIPRAGSRITTSGPAEITAGRAHDTGATIRYTLDVAATVRIAIARRLPGRLAGKTCGAPTRRLSTAKRCTRLSARGTLTRSSGRGLNRVGITGRIDTAALAPGRYHATLIATDAQRNSSRKSTTFTIAAR